LSSAPPLPARFATNATQLYYLPTTVRLPDPAKFFQAKPSKTKQECLDFLGFIRPNQDFSMGYSESK
jgi:hypothetical protein